jgi:hypothetical protein
MGPSRLLASSLLSERQNAVTVQISTRYQLSDTTDFREWCGCAQTLAKPSAVGELRLEIRMQLEEMTRRRELTRWTEFPQTCSGWSSERGCVKNRSELRRRALPNWKEPVDRRYDGSKKKENGS